MALVEARATTAAASNFSSQAHGAMEQRHPYNGGSASASAYYGATSPAAAFPPHAAFGAGRHAAGPAAHLDVFDYLSDVDEGVPAPPAAVPACAFGTPVEQVVPDAGAYLGFATRSAAAVAGEGPTRTDRIAFRMRSEEDVLDDGYKWRKYGKKSVKNSPNPRNYYRCSTEGCNVKKRVERDRDDPNYVVTMYEGVHNHVSPGTIYYASQDAASGRFFVAGTHHFR
ncbi:EcWRKY-26, partial [Eragrostis curvula]